MKTKKKNIFGRFLIAFALLIAILFFNISSAQFETLTSKMLPPPKILSPKNGKVVSGKKVILRWMAVPGATRYGYEMGVREPGMTDYIGSGIPIMVLGTSAEFDLTNFSDGTGFSWVVSGWSPSITSATISKPNQFVYKKGGAKDAKKTKKAKNMKKQKFPKKTESLISAEQIEVEKALQENLPQMRAEIRRLAKDELNIELPERVPEKSEYEGIESFYHSFVGYMDRVEKLYREGDYARALNVVNNLNRDYAEIIDNIPGMKEEQTREAADLINRDEQESENAAAAKKYEEETQTNLKKLAAAKAAEVKGKKKALSCINRYLKFTAPAKYAMSIYQFEGALCPRLSFIPATTYSYWDEESEKTVYEGGPHITIEVYIPRKQYETGSFVAEKMDEGANLKTIKGDSWYYLKSTEDTGKGTIVGENYETFVENTQIRFTVYLDMTDFGKDPKTFRKVKSDFEKMMKTIAINHRLPSKIEPAAALTKEMLLLQGSWKLTKTFFQDDPEIGYPPVKAHLIAFRTNKICSFIQEENTNKCYTRYVPYELEENVLVFAESGSEYHWEILKNTAYELEILDHNGTKNIFRKISNETPSVR